MRFLNSYSFRYSPIPKDLEKLDFSILQTRLNDSHYLASLKRTLEPLQRKRFFKPILVASITVFLICLFQIFRNADNGVHWEEGVFSFSENPRPKYLDTPLQEPIRIRLAIMSRVDEFERRQAHRDYMLKGIPKTDVTLDYRFFVGRSVEEGAQGLLTKAKLWKEIKEKNDVVFLNDLKDIPERLSEKRFTALKWTNSVPSDQYDYSMTVDSDSFCRFSTLARRLNHTYSDLQPTEQPILIARMGSHHVYFENTIPDRNENDEDEDSLLKGPWYPFPYGYAYMLSSNLTNTILSADPAVPHHVNYPSDDVIIGSWTAGLKHFHDPSQTFETTGTDTSEAPRTVRPRPYLPYAVDTNMVDIQTGWNDFKNRGGGDAPIGWESACVHRMKPEEMAAFRKMKEVRREWEDS